jgi:DNA-binding NtrC family response regulator
MKRLRMQVRRIGPHFRSVLVSGEAGTGKEWVARALHAMGRGAGGPFVVCHAAAIEVPPVDFGATVGPSRGTLFLERVSEMPLEVQGRLVRALREQESAQSQLKPSQRTDLRMIAATEEDLRALVSRGRFRQDLYRRLATVAIALPPLRDRMEDLPELARCFLGQFARLYDRSVYEIADEAMENLKTYCWPGNLRELKEVLRNGALQCKGGVVESRHLPAFAGVCGTEPSIPVNGTSVRLQEVVEQHVLRVLKDCAGNKLRAAEVLGISRSTLYRMLDAGTSAAS